MQLRTALRVTLMAGGILAVIGVTGRGTAVKYIPRPGTSGVTHGTVLLLAAPLGTTKGPTVLVAGASLAVISYFLPLAKRVPGSLVALFPATVSSAASRLPIDTAGSKCGSLPSLPSLPLERIPGW